MDYDDINKGDNNDSDDNSDDGNNNDNYDDNELKGKRTFIHTKFYNSFNNPVKLKFYLK